MIAKELITDEILPLKTSDPCRDALAAMEDSKVHHLAIVNDRELLGLISESDINNHPNLDDPLGNVKLSLHNAFISEYQHIFDVIKMMADMKLSLLPVVDNKNNFLGIITLSGLLGGITRECSVSNPGGIIILEMSDSNYSMIEISQIIESNDARILSSFITTRPDSTLIDITIKINKVDIMPVLQTFNRYNYTVKATFAEKDDLDDLKERYDALMNYLKI